MTLDNFDEFFESFNTPVDIKWIDNKEEIIGLFMIRNEVYKIRCKNSGSDVWTFKFYHYDKENNEFGLELTNFNVGALSVLSTIRSGMTYLIENKQPNGIIFGASDKSDSRKKLYSNFSEELSVKYSYNRVTKYQMGKQIFILYKNIEKEKLIDVIMKSIIDESV